MSTSDHELRQADEQAFSILGILGIAVVVFKDLEAASVRDTEELEVRIKLGKAVENWSAAERPFVTCHQSSACNRSTCLVVLDCLCLVEHDTEEHHTMQYPPLLCENFLPPSYLLLSSLAFDRWLILGIRIHYLGVSSDDDIVGPQNLQGAGGIDACTGAVAHNSKATVRVLNDLFAPLGAKGGTSDEKSSPRSPFLLRRLPVDNICYAIRKYALQYNQRIT